MLALVSAKANALNTDKGHPKQKEQTHAFQNQKHDLNETRVTKLNIPGTVAW